MDSHNSLHFEKKNITQRIIFFFRRCHCSFNEYKQAHEPPKVKQKTRTTITRMLLLFIDHEARLYKSLCRYEGIFFATFFGSLCKVSGKRRNRRKKNAQSEIIDWIVEAWSRTFQYSWYWKNCLIYEGDDTKSWKKRYE